ncbi:MAG: nicotinate-nucleotide adenylyltransferase [Verrucomicrobiae bacterium]|nr:nicotinate-nucleotide adenylyltransferase [Verrucomicrobiae bacterium]
MPRKQTLKIGLLGGTFDPLHNGHLTLAADAIAGAGLDRVYLIPSARPPHKSKVRLPAAVRLKLVRAAVRGRKNILASDLEYRRRGPSFTFETLEAFGKIHPGAKLYWIIGADNVAELQTWREPKRIAQRATLLIATRPGHTIQPRLLADFDHEMLPARMMDISSTEIRERLRRGKPIFGLVPGAVEKLLLKGQSYA